MLRKTILSLSALMFLFSGCNPDGPDTPGSGGASINDGNFSVAVSDVSKNSAKVTVTPSDNSALYVYGVISKAEMASLKYEDALAEAALGGNEAVDVIVSGKQSKTFEALKESTEYYAYAIGMNTAGKRTTDVTKVEFKTLAGEGGQQGDGDGDGDGDDDGPVGEGGGVYSETFAGYTGKSGESGYLAQESFTSTATKVTWTLDNGKIDQTEDYTEFYGSHCFTMGGKAGKADSGQSVLTTSVLSDGITRLAFDYIANSNKKLEVQVLVGGSVVWTSNALDLVNNGQSDTKKLEHLSFNITGASSNAVLKFINVSSARRISIGNITWTNATGVGGNGSDFTGGGSDEEDDDDTGGGSITGDVNVVATSVEADYYGDYYECGAEDWNLYMYNDTEELSIEFLGTLGKTSDISGTYTISSNPSGAAGEVFAGSVEDGYIYPTYYYKYISEYDGDYVLITSGTVTITKSGSNYTIVASFKDADGHSITSSYTGPVTITEGEFEDDTEDEDEEEGPYSSLTGDLTVTGLSYATADMYGDDFGVGTNDWYLEMGNEAGETLCFELFTALSATTPVGTFSVDLAYSCDANTVWDGYYTDLGIGPAYYNEGTEDYAYPVSGTLTITNSGTTYTVVVDMEDELGNAIKGTYSGAIDITDVSGDYGYESAKKIARKNGARPVVKASAVRSAGVPAVRSAASAGKAVLTVRHNGRKI